MALESGRNNFNTVRLAAAAAVVVSHSFGIIHGGSPAEPLSSATPFTLGQHAVNVFFVLSGLMLSRSYALNPDLRRFALARVLRIYPGLIVCAVVTAFILGALGTTMSPAVYLADPNTILYSVKVAFEFSRARLPDVFTGGTNPGLPNLPLWTIKFELLAYLLFMAAAALGLLRWRRFAPALLVGSAILVIAIDMVGLEERIPQLVPPGRFAMSFAFGIAAYAYRDRIPLRIDLLAGLGLLAFATHGFLLEKPAFILFTGYGALLLGSVFVPGLSRWTARTDLSYGLYLYAWPVQQLLVHLWPAMQVPSHIMLAFAGALPFAAASWIFVEHPALALKGRRSVRPMTVVERPSV